jgi:hypothetical protein
MQQKVREEMERKQKKKQHIPMNLNMSNVNNLRNP